MFYLGGHSWHSTLPWDFLDGFNDDWYSFQRQNKGEYLGIKFCLVEWKVRYNGKRRTVCAICSKLTVKTPERRHWHRFAGFTVNFEEISLFVLVFPLLLFLVSRRSMSLLLTLKRFHILFWYFHCYFEQVIVNCVIMNIEGDFHHTFLLALLEILPIIHYVA